MCMPHHSMPMSDRTTTTISIGAAAKQSFGGVLVIVFNRQFDGGWGWIR